MSRVDVDPSGQSEGVDPPSSLRVLIDLQKIHRFQLSILTLNNTGIIQKGWVAPLAKEALTLLSEDSPITSWGSKSHAARELPG